MASKNIVMEARIAVPPFDNLFFFMIRKIVAVSGSVLPITEYCSYPSPLHYFQHTITLAEFLGGNAEAVRKNPGEVMRILETYFVSYLCNIEVGSQQDLFGFV